MKRPPTKWEKIFANDISDKGLISKILIKNLYNSIFKKQTTWTSSQSSGYVSMLSLQRVQV